MLSAIWWLVSPDRVSMCSVMPAACAKLANQCGNISVSISPSRGCEKPDFQTQCGRPEMSRVQRVSVRSEEHTSELQSLMRISYAVFCLKKKKLKHARIRIVEIVTI